MTCQGAWDNDEVSSSIWHPGGSGAGASTAMYTGEEVIIHRVTVTQFRVSRRFTVNIVASDYTKQIRLSKYWPLNTDNLTQILTSDWHPIGQ